jgi:hypothetical protein
LNWPKRFPTSSTFSALARCDAQHLVAVIASGGSKARAVEQCGSEPSRLEAHKQESERSRARENEISAAAALVHVDFFDDPDAQQQEWQYAKSVQKGHGRLEVREI